MGYRNSYRHSAQGRRGRARRGGGYPNLAVYGQAHGRDQRGRPIGLKVPPPLPTRPMLSTKPEPKPTARPAKPERAQPARQERVRRGNWLRDGGWYPLLVLPTFGLGSFIPFAHAGAYLDRDRVRIAGIGYSFLPLISVVLLDNAPTDSAGNPTGVAGFWLSLIPLVLTFGGMLAATSHLVVLSRELGSRDRRPDTRERPEPPKVDPALAKALAAREKRKQARELAASDPVLADELRIGRPDLARQYDDGGLVDINNAPAGSIASVCGIEPAAAEAMVGLRAERGGFANVDEMLVLVDLPTSAWERIRDRAFTPLA